MAIFETCAICIYRKNLQLTWFIETTDKQDLVNNANSAFILINRLISRDCQSGSIGPGGPGGSIFLS